MTESKWPAFATFGEMLRRLRQHAHLTQDEFGLAVGYSRAHIARLESNQRLPDVGTVQARFFAPLDLKPDSQEATLLVRLAQAAHAQPLLVDEREIAPTRVVPNNLPYELTSFIGRQQALADLERLLPTTRLLTLTGTGGTGKTRLALKLAERMMAGYPDGVWLVELAPLSEPAQVPLAALSALNLRELLDTSPTAGLIVHLQDKHALLILDNCEHVIDACAQLADALLRGCRHLRILSTSREALGIVGELAWRVPSFSVSDAENVDPVVLQRSEAIALFVERAMFASPTFKLTPENAPAVLRICKRLEGIPLAIELAATRVKALTPAEIAARLDDRFRLLAGGSRTALPRQQTLQAAVDWSYRLLSEPERLLLSRLAVFTGGWTLAAAEQVCAGDGIERDEILTLLSRLVDKSLVVMDDAGIATRYFLLETIRQYAIEKLNAGDEAKAMRDRHLAYYLKLHDQVVDELTGVKPKRQVLYVKLLNPEIDNIRLAIRWSIDTDQMEVAHSLIQGFYGLLYPTAHIHEMTGWLSLIASNPAMNDRIRASAILLAADAYNAVGSFREGQSVINQLMTIGASQDDKHLLARGLLGLIWIAIHGKQFSEAHTYLNRYKAMTLDANFKPDAVFEIYMNGAKALLMLMEGNYPEAIEGHQIFYTHVSQRGNKISSSGIARRLGYAHLLSGDATNALPFFRESMLDNYALNDMHAFGACLFAFGVMVERAGDVPRAACLFAAAAKTVQATGRQAYPWDKQLYEPSLHAVQAQLDQPEIAAMWAKGEAMTLEQAVAFALDA